MTQILIFFMLLCMNSSFAQITEECEKIYTIVEEQPEYKKGPPDLIKHIVTAWCKCKMEKKMLAMKVWTPGKQDGKPVCVAYMLPVRCIMWN